MKRRAIIPMLEAGLTGEGNPLILMPYVQSKSVKDALAGEAAYQVHKVFDEILQR